MQLYAVKTAQQYLKSTESGFELVGMNKASVYPANEDAQALYQKAEAAHLPELRYVMLTITETEL